MSIIYLIFVKENNRLLTEYGIVVRTESFFLYIFVETVIVPSLNNDDNEIFLETNQNMFMVVIF